MSPEVQQILREMGIQPVDFQVIQQAPSFEAAQRLLEVLKEKAKLGYRKLALLYHPDQNENLSPAEKARKVEKFRLATAVKRDLDKLNVSRPQAPPPVMQVPFVQTVQVVYVHYYPSGGPTTSTTMPRTQNAWAATTMHPNGVGGGRGR